MNPVNSMNPLNPVNPLNPLNREKTMFNLKPLSKDAIESALAKAERYRLLNEPDEAESICLDVLAIDPSNETARITSILALTDLDVDRTDAGVGEASGPALASQIFERPEHAGRVPPERGVQVHAKRDSPVGSDRKAPDPRADFRDGPQLEAGVGGARGSPGQCDRTH